MKLELELTRLHNRLLLHNLQRSDVWNTKQQNLKASAVLIPIYPSASGLQVIMIKRPAHMRHHPNQIAFPGGKKDKTDSSLWETAIRETQEELGINHKLIKPLCALSSHNTGTGFNILPFVGILTERPKIKPSKDEVQAVLHFPLANLLNPKNHFKMQFMVKGHKRLVRFINTKDHIIWGATAQILYHLQQQLKD